MPQTYFIDGYNVMHKCSRLRELARVDFEAAREALIDRVARFCANTGKRAQIVFDGKRGMPGVIPPFRDSHVLEIIYSPGNLTADAVIERQVYQVASKSEIVVVSGDRGLRDLCRGMGAFTMQPDNFLTTVEEALSQARSDLKNLQPHAGSMRIEDHLDEASLEHLRNLRERLDGK